VSYRELVDGLRVMKLREWWAVNSSAGLRASLHPEWTFRQRFVRTAAVVLPLNVAFDFLSSGGWHGWPAGPIPALAEAIPFVVVFSFIQHLLAKRYKT
jgi:hypothetical protein